MTVDTVWLGFDGLRVAVRCAAPEAAAEVARTFRAMVVDPVGAGPPAVAELAVERAGGGYRVAAPGAPVEEGPLPEVRRLVRYHATRAFVEARPARFWVHAAAAARGGRALLLPGPRGRGKSTVVTALARAGWLYLSDEAVPLDMADDSAAPFPLTPSVRIWAPGLLAPEAVAALAKRHLALPPEATARAPARITELVFVRYVPGAPATRVPLPPGEAALELLESCLNPGLLRAAGVRYAAALAARAPAARLAFGDVAAAVRLLDAPAPAAA